MFVHSRVLSIRMVHNVASAPRRPSHLAPLVNSADLSGSEETRLLLALQKPNVTARGDGFATVEFTSGPNALSYEFAVACYSKNATIPTDSCSAIAGSGLVPLGSANGTIPKGYSKVISNVTGVPGNTAIDCIIEVRSSIKSKVSKCQHAGSAGTSLFYLDVNGVTVRCPDAQVNDTAIVNGIVYTKRDRAGLDALVGDAATEPELATSCTSGVTNMTALLGGFPTSPLSDPSTFNVDISSWDTSDVISMSEMFAVRCVLVPLS
jgi:hypothetical protein